MKALGPNILLDDCERRIVVGGRESSYVLSYDDVDRMDRMLMALRHPSIVVDEEDLTSPLGHRFGRKGKD